MSDHTQSKKLVEPLGIFGPKGADPFNLTREQLEPLIDLLEPDIRSLVATYLRSGTIIFPLMGYSEDVIGAKFGVSGGIAILSDGTHYWRRDAAEYVEHYGIEIPCEKISQMRNLVWRAPHLDATQVAAIDKFLYRNLRDQ